MMISSQKRWEALMQVTCYSLIIMFLIGVMNKTIDIKKCRSLLFLQKILFQKSSVYSLQ